MAQATLDSFVVTSSCEIHKGGRRGGAGRGRGGGGRVKARERPQRVQSASLQRPRQHISFPSVHTSSLSSRRPPHAPVSHAHDPKSRKTEEGTSAKTTASTPTKLKFEEVRGDLFSCPKTASLAHCVSSDLRMGKGIAVAFKKTFGGVEELKQQS